MFGFVFCSGVDIWLSPVFTLKVFSHLHSLSYTLKHSIFRVNTPEPLGTTNGLTQFGRAMQELDIQIICANSPQAKGRVERANQTLQDRLVKELRLRNLSGGVKSSV